MTARWGTCAYTPGSEEWLRSSKQGSQLIFGKLELTSVHSEGWIREKSSRLGDYQNHPEGESGGKGRGVGMAVGMEREDVSENNL